MKIKKCRFIDLHYFDDGNDGNLVIAESFKDIPFGIKRVYFINNLRSKKATRGKHAHKKLEQVLFCINGSFDLELEDGCRKERLRLGKAHRGIYMGPGVWHTMKNFSPECVILVLASDFYKKSDYIRHYHDFLKFVKLKDKR